MIPRLHAVTDDRILAGPGFLAAALEVLEEGAERLALHLRGPRTPGARVFRFAADLRAAARGTGSLLLVNDRVDVALAADLDGVHLGQRSLPAATARDLLGDDRIVGVSVHDRSEAERASEAGARYLVVGSIFATPSHPEIRPRGPALLVEVADRITLPLVAIGGLTPDRVPEVLAAGARGVAAVSGIWGEDGGESAPAPAVREFLAALPEESR